MIRPFLLFSICLILSLFFLSCQKEAGEGGTAMITGKVYAKDVRNGFLIG